MRTIHFRCLFISIGKVIHGLHLLLFFRMLEKPAVTPHFHRYETNTFNVLHHICWIQPSSRFLLILSCWYQISSTSHFSLNLMHLFLTTVWSVHLIRRKETWIMSSSEPEYNDLFNYQFIFTSMIDFDDMHDSDYGQWLKKMHTDCGMCFTASKLF